MQYRKIYLSFWGVQKAALKRAISILGLKPLGGFLTILVVALIVALPSSLYLVGKNITKVTSQATNSSQITVYLEQKISNKNKDILLTKLKKVAAIEKVEYISPKDGLAEFQKNTGLTDSLKVLDTNPLPPVCVISLKNRFATASLVAEVAANLSKIDFIESVRVDGDWLQRLDALKNVCLQVVLVFFVLCTTALFIIVGNTLRLQILSSKEELLVMRLVGATDGFILRPFLYLGAIVGLAGGIIALFLLHLLPFLFENVVDNFASFYLSNFEILGISWDESLLLLFVTALLGWGAAHCTARKYLRDIEPN